MPDTWRPSSSALYPDDWETLLAAYPVVVIHFWAIWDAHDRTLDGHLQRLREEFADRIAVRSVDVDRQDSQSLIEECEVGNVPALAAFIRGRREQTLIGVRSVEVLRRLMHEWLALALWFDNQGASPGG